jgi:branched-chain amino acid transport system substrate-binding protein
VPDYTPFYQRVRNAKADCFFVFVPGGAHSTAAAKTFKRLGMDKAGIKLIATGDLTQDTRLADMGDAAIGMITVHHYSAFYDTPANKAFVAEWKKAYGADSLPDFFAVQGYDSMAAVFRIVKTVGAKIDGTKAMAALAGWTFQSPRGMVTIDEATRDVIQDQNVHEVVKDGDRIVIKVIDTYPQMKDPCKELKVGRCGQ